MAAGRPLTRVVMIGHAPATFPRKRFVHDFTSRGKRASADATPRHRAPPCRDHPAPARHPAPLRARPAGQQLTLAAWPRPLHRSARHAPHPGCPLPGTGIQPGQRPAHSRHKQHDNGSVTTPRGGSSRSRLTLRFGSRSDVFAQGSGSTRADADHLPGPAPRCSSWQPQTTRGYRARLTAR
jgi:hypothetical protein